LILVDTVGVNDTKVPENVKDAINIFSSSKEGINSENFVKGATNISIDDTSHTGIDDDHRVWTIINDFIENGTISGGGGENEVKGGVIVDRVDITMPSEDPPIPDGEPTSDDS
jgi:uncharacterized protein (UPF0147 family)